VKTLFGEVGRTIRYALAGNSRTVRLCVIVVVAVSVYIVATRI